MGGGWQAISTQGSEWESGGAALGGGAWIYHTWGQSWSCRGRGGTKIRLGISTHWGGGRFDGVHHSAMPPGKAPPPNNLWCVSPRLLKIVMIGRGQPKKLNCLCHINSMARLDLLTTNNLRADNSSPVHSNSMVSYVIGYHPIGGGGVDV